MSSATAVASDIDRLLDEIQNDTGSGELPAYQPARRTAAPVVSVTTRGSAVSPALPSLASRAPIPKTTSTAKILVIDDEPINVKVCHKYLRELGY